MSIQSIDVPAVLSEVIYKELPHLPGYRIGSDGSVWSERARIRVHTGVWKRLKGGRLPGGHLYVNLVSLDRQIGWPHFIHRLVLEAFVGPCPPGMEACHFPDRDPANNRLENLRWDTHAENMKDAVKHGTHMRGTRFPGAVMTDESVRLARSLREKGWENKQIAEHLGVSAGVISLVVTGKRWRHVV